MADDLEDVENGEEVKEDKVEQRETGKSDRELERLKQVVANLQKERDESRNALEEMRQEQERAKLSESERMQADLESWKSKLSEREKRLAELERERQVDRDSFELYARHNLADIELAGIVLKRRQEDESLEDLVKRVKDKMPKFYWRDSAASEKVEEEVESPGLHGGEGSGRRRVNTELVSMEDQRRAEILFPRDAAKQKAFLDRLKRGK